MVQIINLPEGQTASFPDDMSRDDIQAVLQKHYNFNQPQQSQQPQPSSTSSPASPSASPSLLDTLGKGADYVNTIGNGTLLEKGVDYINAAGGGVRKGAMDAVGDMASLAGNLVRLGLKPILPDSANNALAATQNSLSQYGNQFKNYVNDNPIDTQAAQEHPLVNAVGAGTGYVLTNAALSSLASKPIQAAGDAATGVLLPKTLQSPILNSTVSGGLTGGIMGAGANPDTPGQGFMYGAAIGASIGAISRYLSNRTKEAGQIINNELQDAKNAGLVQDGQAVSPDVMNKIRAELSVQGANQAKLRITDQVTKNIKNATPNFTDHPVETIVNTIVDNSTAAGQSLDPTQINDLKNHVSSLLGSKNPSLNDFAELESSLGQSGKQLISSALLSKTVENSTLSSGRISLRLYDKQLAKLVNSEVGQQYLSGEYAQAAEGLKTLVTAGKQMIGAQKMPESFGIFKRVYQGLIHSNAGISLLKVLGSTSPTSETAKTLVYNLLLGTAAIGYSRGKIVQQSQNNQNTPNDQNNQIPIQ